MSFEKLIPLFSDKWKERYRLILAEEHLKSLDENMSRYKSQSLDWSLPFFKEELIIDRDTSFKSFTGILDSEMPDRIKAGNLEEIPFEHWLNILGQRLTSASLRDERAVPPLRKVLTEACEKPFNSEISIAQRAWEKHSGRREGRFWGQVKGNNRQKQRLVMEKINAILDHTTWWNVFFHYKHGPVYEVREKEGHGIRWSHGGNQLIGFLEVFMDD